MFWFEQYHINKIKNMGGVWVLWPVISLHYTYDCRVFVFHQRLYCHTLVFIIHHVFICHHAARHTSLQFTGREFGKLLINLLNYHSGKHVGSKAAETLISIFRRKAMDLRERACRLKIYWALFMERPWLLISYRALDWGREPIVCTRKACSFLCI